MTESETRRQKLLCTLENASGCWTDEDHPELRDGACAWVRSLRDEWDNRLEELLTRWHSESKRERADDERSKHLS